MRVRTLLATTVAGVLLAVVPGLPASADPGPVPANRTGHLVAWGPDSSAEQTAVSESLTGKQVVNVSTSDSATGVVTSDGLMTIWGDNDAAEVTNAPSDLTDIVSLALGNGNALALRADGTVVGWGADPAVSAVPDGLRAKSIAISSAGGVGTAYAVRTDGTLASWGTPYSDAVVPNDLTNLVDVTATATQAMALDAQGHVTVWAFSGLAEYVAPSEYIQGRVTKIASGGNVDGAILNDGSVVVWGVGAPDVPDTGGKKAVALDVHRNSAVVLEDGSVMVFGPYTGTTDTDTAIKAVPAALDGETVGAVAISATFAAVIVTDFRAVTAPTITGSPMIGQSLTATPATLSLTPDAPATGQWYADADPIAGQTGTTLVLGAAQIGKKISYRTTATRGETTVTSASVEVGPVVPKRASVTKVAISPSAGAYGTARTVTATVTSPGGTPTGTVTITVGGSHVTRTLAGGKATWVQPKTLAVGSRTVTAGYQGSVTVATSTSAAATLTVSKAASKATAKAKVTGKTKKYAKKVKLTVTVKTAAGVSPAGKVTVTVAGKKITASVNSHGTATVSFKKVKHGKHVASVKYAGNSHVAGSKGSVKFKA